MKYLVGIITCLTLLAGLWITLPGPVQAQSTSQRQAQINHAKQQHDRWMAQHRIFQRLNNQAFDQRNHYPQGSPAWHSWNRKVNELMRRMAICQENMRYWDNKYEQLKYGKPSQPTNTSGWKPGDGLLGVKPGP